MKVYQVNHPSELESVLKTALENSKDVHVLFYGSLVPETNKSWCSDCVDADPKIKSHITEKEEGSFIECPVGDRASWKGVADHPYRVHPQASLKAIPTLIRWTKEGPQNRLVEEECSDDDLLKKFFNNES
ncbi:hypothetical protein DSO57_1000796 [Entomophthora muscae]|uniref:Uncharacterized protein n=1 Tax=Entomophthora muscae TaxID=34485 RepID=A0ACC2T925_9FUNG|nr:hypothetical protein DSO57_1000796 [Entomophthora muscae]